MDARELVQELRSRHIASTAPTSRALVATIDALTETLEAFEKSNDLLLYVGACISSLDSVSSADDAPVTGAVCTLLGTLLPHVSQQQTRSIFLKTSPVMCKVAELLYEGADMAGLKWAAKVLTLLLCYPDTEATWAPVKEPMLMLVRISLHSNAKARKMAQEGLSNVLSAYQGTPSHRAASEEIEQVAKVLLAAPKLAAKQAASATKSQRQDAEDAIVQSVQECLYFMGALKLLLPHLTATASLRVCEFILDTFVLAQPILTMNGVDCLIQALQGFSQQGVPASKTQQLLTAVLPMLDTQKPASVLLSLIRFVEDGMRELQQHGEAPCEQALPGTVLKLVEMLGAETEDVRFAAASAVTTVFQCCVSQRLVVKCAEEPPSGAASHSNALKRCMVAIVSMLGVGYRDSWPHVLRCLADVFTVLGPAGASLAVPVVQVVAPMARAGEDGEPHVKLAKAVLGACISGIGPQVLLQVAPFDLQDLANTWTLPLLRKHTRCTQMALWGEYFLPRARAVGAVAISARDSGNAGDHLKLAALELQIWMLLESFARWAHDVPGALEKFGETLGSAFHNRRDLQAPICGGLKQLCAQTSAALRHAGEPDGAGFGLGADPDEGGEQDGASVAAAPVFEDSVPGHFDASVARAHRDSLRLIAQKWLQELLNRFVQLKPDKRAPVAEAVRAVAMVAGEAITGPFYKEALSKVVASLQDIKAGDAVGDPEANVCTFLEVGLLLAGGVSEAAMLPLFKAAQLVVAVKRPAVQKKAYKVLAYLFMQRPEVLERCKQAAAAVLLEGSSTDVAAKRFRLKCMQPVILMLSREGQSAWCSPTEQPAHAAQLIAEVVLGIKEVNAKTRTEAYRVLAATAHALYEADPPAQPSFGQGSGSAAGVMRLDDGGLQRMFACTLAGVASQSPRMTAASVMALARLLFEFSGELQLPATMMLPRLCALLHSKAREVIKSVLGFLKVAAVRLPVDVLQPQLHTIIQGLLVWAEDSKNRFKMKVRRLLERLCKKCGYEDVAAAWPDSDPKLLSSIRKGLARMAREKSARKGVDDEGASDGGDSEMSRGRRTAAGSEWRHTRIFSDEGEDGGGGEDGDARSRAGQSTTRSHGARSKNKPGVGGRKAAATGQLVNEGSSPVNLLDTSSASVLVRSAAGKRHVEEEPLSRSEFERNAAGKLVFKEEKESKGKREDDDPLSTKWRKRRRPDTAAMGSDDSDFEDMAGVAGLSAGLKGSLGVQSLKGASKYAHSHASWASGKSKASRATDPGQHSAAKYKAKKASGDNQGGSKVEPYAYWRFDKNMLNSRAGKQQRAKSQLGSMVKGGAVRGNKAKKARKSE